MKKEYITPSIHMRLVRLTNLMEQSVPVSGSTDDRKPNETKFYYGFNEYGFDSDEE